MSAKAVFQRYATPLTTGLFLVSTVSGVALFLHLGSNWFREMHEILSLVLLVPVGVHLWRNWTALLCYFRRSAFWISMAVSLGAAGLFLADAGSGGGNPAMAFVGAAQKAPVSALAPVIGIDETEILHRLTAAGISPVQPADSLAAIAERSGRAEFELLALVQAPAATPSP